MGSIRPRTRVLVSSVALTAAFAAGMGLRGLSPRSAHAEPMTVVSTVYVPAEGIVFRATDGKAIAKLSRDAHGGFLELYDDSQDVGVRLSSGVSRPTPTRPPRESYLLDDDDPFINRGPPASIARPPAGY